MTPAYWHLYASACGVVNSSIQRRLLAEQSLTLKQAHDLARAMETAEKNVKDMQKPSLTNTTLHMVTHTEGSTPPGFKFDSLRWLLSHFWRRTLQPGPNYAIRAAAASDERYSYRAELCYINLASPALSLQATSTHISSLHEHVAARKILGSLKNWSGHGLSNRTGSAGPARVPGRLGLLLAAPRLCIYCTFD